MKYFLKLVVLLLGFSFGCDIPNEFLNEKFQYSLVFNLTVNQENQEFYIYRIVDDELEFYSGSPDRYFEKNADIFLFNSGFSFNSFIVKELPNNNDFAKSLLYTNSNELELKPNTNYKIDITVNDVLIAGNTKTPSDFNIISPTANSTLELVNLQNEKSIKIKWQKSLSAKGYFGQIYQTYIVEWPDTSFAATRRFDFITQDTLFNYSDYVRSTGTFDINIFAYDLNYHNHFIERFGSTGVEGGYGYFASSVKKSVSIILE